MGRWGDGVRLVVGGGAGGVVATGGVVGLKASWRDGSGRDSGERG